MCSTSAADNKLSNQRLFTDFMVDGVHCGPDGMRCDVDGNVWCSSNAGRAVGYSGVTVWTPDGKLIGRIRLPEVVRQHLLRRPQAKSPVHGGKPVACTRSTSTPRAQRPAEPRHAATIRSNASDGDLRARLTGFCPSNPPAGCSGDVAASPEPPYFASVPPCREIDRGPL